MTKFKVNDLVWATPPGSHPWPSIILDFPKDSTPVQYDNEVVYWCFLFGSQELVWVKESTIEPYLKSCEKHKACYKGGQFARGVRDIEEIISNISSDPNYVIDISLYKREYMSTNGYGSTESNGQPPLIRKRKSLSTESNSQLKRGKRRHSYDTRSQNDESQVLQNVDSQVSQGDDLNASQNGHITAEFEIERGIISQISPDKKIGFIGLGNIGEAFVKHIIEAGCTLFLWSRSIKKCKSFVNNFRTQTMDQVTVCDSAKDVAFKSDIIFSCLNDENSVKFVLFNSRHGIMADSIFAPIIKNKIYVEMTSIPIKLSKQICATVAQNGGLYVEMQFQGSRRDAEQGRLISYYAGHMAGVKKCTPYLSLITTNTVHFLGRPGMAIRFQILLQLVRSILLAGVAEALALADKCDIPKEDFMAIFKETNFASPYLTENMNRMIKVDFEDNIQHRVELMNNNINLALNLGASVKFELMMASAAKEIYKKARHLGFDGKDVSCVYIGCCD